MKVEITMATVFKIIGIIITVGTLLVSVGVFIHTSHTTQQETRELREDLDDVRTVMSSLQMTLIRIETEFKFKNGKVTGGVGGVGVGMSNIKLKPLTIRSLNVNGD